MACCALATQPCPCGYYNHPTRDCVCAPGVVQRYLNKISGPLLDRIDIHIEVVEGARKVQQDRFEELGHVYCNAQMSSSETKRICKIGPEGIELLKTAMTRLNLSARAYDRILKVARTIADLEHSETVQTQHLAEAIQYRSLDRENWAG